MLPMKTKDIAAGILLHLQRFEANPEINRFVPARTTNPYYMVNCHAAGSRVFIRYVSYQGRSSLTKDQAYAYLDALHGGYIGKHYFLPGIDTRPGTR